MACLGLEPGAAGWKAQTNPLIYGGTPNWKIVCSDASGTPAQKCENNEAFFIQKYSLKLSVAFKVVVSSEGETFLKVSFIILTSDQRRSKIVFALFGCSKVVRRRRRERETEIESRPSANNKNNRGRNWNSHIAQKGLEVNRGGGKLLLLFFGLNIFWMSRRRNANIRHNNWTNVSNTWMNDEGPARHLGKVETENTHHTRRKYHCTADLLFDWFGFDTTSKTAVHST